jgi:hypothetical protein
LGSIFRNGAQSLRAGSALPKGRVGVKKPPKMSGFFKNGRAFQRAGMGLNSCLYGSVVMSSVERKTQSGFYRDNGHWWAVVHAFDDYVGPSGEIEHRERINTILSGPHGTEIDAQTAAYDACIHLRIR